MWLSSGRNACPEITNPEKHVPFAPDLAVEVLSPNDRPDEVEEKVQEWLAAGSRAVWTVDADGEDGDRFIARVPSRSLSQRIKTSRAVTSCRASYAGSHCSSPESVPLH